MCLDILRKLTIINNIVFIYNIIGEVNMIFQKKRYNNGKREIYIFGKRVLIYYADKLKRVRKNCDIPYNYIKYLYREKNLQIIHPIGVVITKEAKFGNNCRIYQNTTIGQKNGMAPTIGNNVEIFANSVVIGNVHIGDNSIIGAGSVVTKDIPANEVWAVNPAHFIKRISENRLQK